MLRIAPQDEGADVLHLFSVRHCEEARRADVAIHGIERVEKRIAASLRSSQ